MKRRHLMALVALCLVMGLFIGGSIWTYRKWCVDKAAEDKRWGNHCVHAHDVVIGSELFSKELLDQIASDFLQKRSKTANCDWFYYPTWNGKRKNPNWFSKTYGSDGMNVTCETSAKHEDGSDVDLLVFEWDVNNVDGMTGFKWEHYRYFWPAALAGDE